MATIIPFPQQQHLFSVDICAGCGDLIKGDYWEVDVPGENNKLNHIALCEPCYGEVIKHGVSL